MIVVDASVVVDYLLGGPSPAGDELARRFDDGDVVIAPQLLDAEVGQVVRRYALRGELDDTLAEGLVRELVLLPIRRYPHAPVIVRAFDLRANATVYDGIYLALAEAADASLLTADARLADVPGVGVDVEVVPTAR